MSINWGHWPLSDCKARATQRGEVYKCDLRRNHGGDHAAERGMYWVVWSAITSTAEDYDIKARA